MTRLATTRIATLVVVLLLASPANGGFISTSEFDVDDGDWILHQGKCFVEFGDEHANVLEDSFGENLAFFGFSQESIASYGFEMDTTAATMNPDITAQDVGLFDIQYEAERLQAELSTSTASVFGEGLVIQRPAMLGLGLDKQPALRAATARAVPRGSHAPEPKPHPLLLNDEAITTASGRELVSRILRDSLEKSDGEVPSQASNHV